MTNERALTSLHAARASVIRVIEISESMLADGVGDLDVNQQRLIDGESELAILDQQIDALLQGDLKVLKDAASTMPPPPGEGH